MPKHKPTLYQFPISHYCEKARWALDYKEIDYELVNLVPGPHIQALKRLGATQTQTPALTHNDKLIQGSEQIIDYLESIQKHPPLTPANAEGASMAHEWARFADRNIGIPLRLYFYFHILPQRTLAIQLLTQDCPWWARPLYTFAFPGIRKRMRKAMKIDTVNAAAAAETIIKSLDHVAKRISERDYLVDNRFTRADLTVVSLLAPCWRDMGQLPPGLDTFIELMKSHDAVRWAQGVYQKERHNQATKA